MNVWLTQEQAEALTDLARDEIKSIERGNTYYGSRDDNLDQISLLTEAIELLTGRQEGDSDALAR